MKLHSFGKIFSLVAVLALMFALTFAVSVTANAEEANLAPVAQSEETITISTSDLVDPTCGKVKFVWNAIDGATTYRLYLDGVHVANVSSSKTLRYVHTFEESEMNKEHTFAVDAVANAQVVASGTFLYTPTHVWNDTIYETDPYSCWRIYPCVFDGCDQIAKVEEIHEGLSHEEAVSPSCHQNGNMEYWHCTKCMQVWQDEERTQLTNYKNVIVPYDVANIEHFEKVENGCHWNGMQEYWHCTECDAVFTDAALIHLTNMKNLVIPMTGSLVHKEARDATCCQDGNVEHWYCTGDCQGVWTNEELTELTNHKSVVIPHNVDNIEHVAKVDVGCHQNGMQEYWYCKECDAVYSEATLDIRSLTNRKNLVIAYESENVVHVKAADPTCCQYGNIEYWYCTECDAVFTDAALTQISNRKSVLIPYDRENNVKHVDALEPTCHQNGNVEYWYCEVCEAVYSEETLDIRSLTNRKNVVIPCTAEIGHEDAIAVTCHTNGQVEFWFCTECGAVFTDALRTQLSNRKNVVIAYDSANIGHEDAIKVGCHQNGQIEYWFCKTCKKMFSDVTLDTEIIDELIYFEKTNITKYDRYEATCHVNGCEEYWQCNVCKDVFADAALKELTSVENLTIAFNAENIIHEDAIEVQCHVNGRLEHWYCSECYAVYTDAALKELTNFKNIVVPYSADNITHCVPTDPTCHQYGNIEYWFCNKCDASFLDSTLQIPEELDDILISYVTANIAHVSRVEPGCHATGMNEYWYCLECDAVFADAALKQLTNRKNLVINCTAEIKHYDKVDPTCTNDGNIEYWQCSECAATFSDATLKTPKNHVIKALGHKWQNATCTEYETCKVCQATYGAPLGHTEIVLEGRDATCTKNGLTEGKKCTVCGEITVKQKTIDAIGHNYRYDPDPNKILRYEICENCGERNPKEHNPKFQFTDTLTKITIAVACVIVITICVRLLFRPASTTPWYRRRR